MAGASGVKHRVNACHWRRGKNVVAALALIAIVGCGGRYDASVSGMAKLNGSPLPSGSIVNFTPANPGPAPYGLVDDSGAYKVMTGRDTGLPSGEYVVTVVANGPPVPGTNASAPPA